MGRESPLGRVYELDGYVLLLGVGHGSNTSLHLAEYLAEYDGKPYADCFAPMTKNGVREWVRYRDIDLDAGDFEDLGAAFEKTGRLVIGDVGKATARLMKQRVWSTSASIGCRSTESRGHERATDLGVNGWALVTTDLTRFDDELYLSTPDAALDRPVIGVIAASGGTLMFDACSSHRHALELKRAIRARDLRPPDYAVISHSHADHWFGLVDFATVSMCSHACQATTKSMTPWTGAARPSQTSRSREGSGFLADILDAEYGSRPGAISLRSPRWASRASSRSTSAVWWSRSARSRRSHSGDAVILLLSPRRAVFLGDVLYLRENDEEEVRDLLNVLDRLDAEWFIDSHVDGILTREQVEAHLRDYVGSL